MRLFVAVNFNAETRLKLLALRDELRTRAIRGSFVAPENIHMTLVFLGDCTPKQVSAAKKAMNKAAFSPFDICIDSLGRFKRSGSDLWWAGVRENDALLSLQRRLSENLTRGGFKLDNDSFRPHITLGRKVVSRTVPRSVEPFGQTVTSIDLMSSESINDVLTYTSIHQVP